MDSIGNNEVHYSQFQAFGAGSISEPAKKATNCAGVLQITMCANIPFNRFLPSIMSRSEALHAGWFGPSGAASFLYALELLRRIRDPIAAREAYLAVTWMVLISVFLHSITGRGSF
eukprot:1140065-Pelagomonas_calceolata.AAC.3